MIILLAVIWLRLFQVYLVQRNTKSFEKAGTECQKCVPISFQNSPAPKSRWVKIKCQRFPSSLSFMKHISSRPDKALGQRMSEGYANTQGSRRNQIVKKKKINNALLCFMWLLSIVLLWSKRYREGAWKWYWRSCWSSAEVLLVVRNFKKNLSRSASACTHLKWRFVFDESHLSQQILWPSNLALGVCRCQLPVSFLIGVFPSRYNKLYIKVYWGQLRCGSIYGWAYGYDIQQKFRAVLMWHLLYMIFGNIKAFCHPFHEISGSLLLVQSWLIESKTVTFLVWMFVR